MPTLVWGAAGTRFFEAGVDKGVLYVGSNPGIAWNGLVSINEETDGGEAQPFYYDGIKYLNIAAAEEFKATLEAFTYPDEFGVCDGTANPFDGLFITHQRRVPFGLSYRTKVGNDLDGSDHAYKIHLIYNALAEPASRSNSTIDEALAPTNFSWNLSTRAPAIADFRRTAHFIVDSRTAAPEALQDIESILYGTDELGARLPSIEEILEIFTNAAVFVVTDNGDGTFTVTGPDILFEMLSEDTFQITSPTAIVIDDDTYTLSSST